MSLLSSGLSNSTTSSRILSTVNVDISPATESNNASIAAVSSGVSNNSTSSVVFSVCSAAISSSILAKVSLKLTSLFVSSGSIAGVASTGISCSSSVGSCASSTFLARFNMTSMASPDGGSSSKDRVDVA